MYEYKRLTNKLVLDAGKVAKINGYWSEEFRNFLDKIAMPARNKIDNIFYTVYNSKNSKSEYEDLLKKNNLI